MVRTPRSTQKPKLYFYNPEWRPRSPGAFSILTQLEYAKKKGLRHAYLGYWIAACPSMQYKARFRPHEILRFYPGDDETPAWDPAETAETNAAGGWAAQREHGVC